MLQIVAVVEPRAFYKQRFGELFKVPEQNQFESKFQFICYFNTSNTLVFLKQILTLLEQLHVHTIFYLFFRCLFQQV